jgi:CheY-like chemotaxis protein
MDGTQISILLVDDQPKLARLVTELLNRLGFPDVDTATDGHEALEKLRAQRFGLVISDLNMEPMDGLQLLRAIRTDKAFKNVSFILTEASITFEQVTLAHHMGADAFLLKPFDLPLFKAKMKSVLSQRGRRKERSIDWSMLPGQELASLATLGTER